MGDLDPIEYMVPRAHPSPQPKRHLDRCSHFAGITSVTDRLTDHTTRSVTIGHIYVRNTATRPKKTAAEECRNEGTESRDVLDIRLYPDSATFHYPDLIRYPVFQSQKPDNETR